MVGADSCTANGKRATAGRSNGSDAARQPQHHGVSEDPQDGGKLARRDVARWRAAASSWGQIQLAQQGGIAGIRGDALEQRITAQPLDPGIVVDGPVEPVEGLIGIAEIRIGLGNLELGSVQNRPATRRAPRSRRPCAAARGNPRAAQTRASRGFSLPRIRTPPPPPGLSLEGSGRVRSAPPGTTGSSRAPGGSLLRPRPAGRRNTARAPR